MHNMFAKRQHGSVMAKYICDALRNLVPFVQFKNIKNISGGVLLSGSLKTY